MKKKNGLLIYPFAVLVFFLILSNSCKDDNNDPTLPATVTDINGNVYHTVTIGTQVWMVENLKVTKYRDGTPIPYITDGSDWTFLTTRGCCDYEHTASNSAIYGKRYNWYAVSDSHNIAPIGWHVPTDAEWTILTEYLGGELVAGGKLKDTTTTFWLSPNTSATNSTGFKALPGGFRNDLGQFKNLAGFGGWWSSTEVDSYLAYSRVMASNNGTVERHNNYSKTFGFSVRCLKDK
jgi:uncharacterized protein (TIGR02145 family)